jgi:hypothetical protein
MLWVMTQDLGLSAKPMTTGQNYIKYCMSFPFLSKVQKWKKYTYIHSTYQSLYHPFLKSLLSGEKNSGARWVLNLNVSEKNSGYEKESWWVLLIKKQRIKISCYCPLKAIHMLGVTIFSNETLKIFNLITKTCWTSVKGVLLTVV